MVVCQIVEIMEELLPSGSSSYSDRSSVDLDGGKTSNSYGDSRSSEPESSDAETRGGDDSRSSKTNGGSVYLDSRKTSNSNGDGGSSESESSETETGGANYSTID